MTRRAAAGAGLRALLRVVSVMRVVLPMLLAMLAPGPAPAVELEAGERARILAHGPWPPPPARDAGNRWAGRAGVAALGQQLFFDPRLAPDGRLACASCHQPAQAFADGRPRSLGRVPLDRNAPSLWNAVHERWLGWDGAADSLWSQSLRALRDPREMGSDAGTVRRLITQDTTLACRWRQGFGDGPPAADEALLVDAAKALGAFVGSLVSARAPFDDFRDALARGDAAQMKRYPADARRGLQLFVGRGRCHLCHAGPGFSNGEFADIGAGFFIQPGQVDAGRHGGIVALRASRYNLLSPWADEPGPAGDAATKTRHVQLQHRNFGEFKVPSLRNVTLTAPYLHDGRLATLPQVLRHYSELDLERLHADGERILEPLHLSPRELDDLQAFLVSLSDPGATRWQAPPLPDCPG